MAEIKFSSQALNDLLCTKAYITDDLCNEQAAVNTVTKIVKQIKQLETFPLSGSSLSSVTKINTDYRFLVCGNYTTFYRTENEIVYIVRVLYGKRNYMQILFDESNDT